MSHAIVHAADVLEVKLTIVLLVLILHTPCRVDSVLEMNPAQSELISVTMEYANHAWNSAENVILM